MAEYPHVRAAFINAIDEEGTKEEAVKFLQAQWNETCALRAEIERLNNALTEAVNQISDLAARLGQAEGRLDASELVGVVEGWKARAEKAEAERDVNAKWLGELLAVIHRDGGHYQSQHGDEKAVAESHRIWARLITERDEALAQVATAFKVAAENCARKAKDCDQLGFASYRDAYLAAKSGCKALTPADAKAALEAYGREKVREGMQRAAALGNELPDVMWDMPWTEYEHGIASLQSAILAEMETLK